MEINVAGPRRIPTVATIVVLAAVALMVRLGFWQLDRLEQKEALLALYSQVDPNSALLEQWDGEDPAIAYRRVSGECTLIGEPQLVAGRNASDEAGYVAAVPCRIFGVGSGNSYVVVLGWTNHLSAVAWGGGAYSGVLVPTDKTSVATPVESPEGDDPSRLPFHIVADPPLAGLQANARPDPNDLPNNHLAYAWQWFLFAATAVVIYTIALRRRMRGNQTDA